jgi:plasmid maintenance system antidote protein VapI
LRLSRYFVTCAEMCVGWQDNYNLRLARYQKEKEIERDVEPLAAVRPAVA